MTALPLLYKLGFTQDGDAQSPTKVASPAASPILRRLGSSLSQDGQSPKLALPRQQHPRQEVKFFMEGEESSIMPSSEPEVAGRALGCQAYSSRGKEPAAPKRSCEGLQKRRHGLKLSIACPTTDDKIQNIQAGSSWVEQFELFETLGQGTTGLVRRAIRKSDKREVAVKMMQAFDEEMISLRRQEFNLLQRAQHPYIVKALEFFTAPGQAALVLDYFPGQTLDDAIRMSPDHKLSEASSRALSEMLFQAIECLHQHRIVHRDIKAVNILVSHDCKDLRLIDFDASRCMLEGGSLTMTGTVQYLPPEVLQGESPSESCDVWSAGLCLHFMLAGYLPWQSRANRGHASYAQKIMKTPLCLEGNPWQSVSEECKAFLRLCLNLDSKLRPTPTTLLQHAWLGGKTSRKKPACRNKFATEDPSIGRTSLTMQGTSISEEVGLLRNSITMPAREACQAS